MKKSGEITKEEKRNKECGAILTVSLLVTVAMLILALPFLSRLSAQYRVAEKSYKSLTALSLAEAGVERAIWEFNHGDADLSNWDGDISLRTMFLSSFQASGGDVVGDIQIYVSDPEGVNPVVEAMGSVSYTGNSTIDKTVRVVLEKELEPVFSHSFFAHTGIQMKGNAIMDSYDSESGPYDPENPSSNGTIATNSTANDSIKLENNTNINGDVICGPEGNPDEVIDLRNSAVINGDTDTLRVEKQFPPIPPPEGLIYKDNYNSDHNPLLITESAEYHDFQIKGGDIVTVMGGTAEEPITIYVNHDMKMDSNASFVVEEGSVVEVILGHRLDMNSNSYINNLTQDAKGLVILGTDSCDQIKFRSNQDSWTSIYTPLAEVTFESNGDFYGSLVADYIKLDSNVGLHYDESLAEWDKYSEETGNIIVKSWKEKIQ